jgi:hypothetical protein
MATMDPEKRDESPDLEGDDARLISTGHKPELKRVYTFWSLMGMCYLPNFAIGVVI